MIRNANEDDKIALGEVYCYSWKSAYNGIIPEEYLKSLSIESCTPNSINPLANLIIEDDASKVVGLVNFSVGRDMNIGKSGEIRAIYVLPEYWSQGFGKELFFAALEKLREMKFDTVYLWVLKDNIRARSFYERMNMICTNDEKSINIAGKSLLEIKYELSLTK